MTVEDSRAQQFASIDGHIAANLRACREAAGVSQEDLAQRMTARGFGFRQATVWKIEAGQRPVKASELLALQDCLPLGPLTRLTDPPLATRHRVGLNQARQAAFLAYQQLKAGAADYIEAQVQLAFTARAARDDGLPLTELDTAMLRVPAEEAVIEARVKMEQQTPQADLLDAEVTKITEALRAAGYMPILNIDDIETA